VKRWTALFVSLLVAMMMFASAAFAEEKQVTVQVDGDAIAFESALPIIKDGVTYAPAESLYEALELVLDESGAAVRDGQPVELAGEPATIDGAVYIPVRAAGESAGYEVRWEPATRTVVLVSKAAETGGRGFLWEVEHNGNKVYLLGSMHLADESFYPLHPAMEAAFDEADYLGVEVDVSKGADPEVQELILGLGSYQDGTKVQDHVSKETYDKLTALLTELELPADSFDTFKPWVIEMTIQSLQAMASGLEGQVGIDMHFTIKAMERSIPVIELESYESQLRMFDDFSPELQEEMLSATIDNFHVIDDGLDAMATVWKTGDDAALIELTESFSESEEYNQAMLVDRNKGMTEKVVGYLNGTKQETYLIVVGAAHMLGESGIVTSLQEQGYTVTRK